MKRLKQLPKEIVEKYNIPVPRYTSYPPANLFTAAYDEADYLRDVESSNHEGAEALSFYIHVPFCRSICHFCACNKVRIPRESDRVAHYFKHLHQEIELLAPHLDSQREIIQIHFGGGSPSSVPLLYIKEVINALTSKFTLSPNAEVAIEVHPGYVGETEWEALLDMPFTRYSVGIQDFNHEVLSVANRQPSLIEVKEIVEHIHAKGRRVNLDFIYGLPHQTVASFRATIEAAIELRPDRLVTFSYAHVPWLHPQQKALERAGLPSVKEKKEMYEMAAHTMVAQGYEMVGLDHFVLPDDPLAVAQRTHRLHRNFQGYCPLDLSGQVYALGNTGISQLHNSYAQNQKSIQEYEAAVASGHLPIAIGYHLSQEESLARDIITDLMCNYRTAPLAHAQKYGLDLSRIEELPILHTDRLQEMVQDGLVEVTRDQQIIVHPEAHFFVRNVAAAFDLHYNPDAPKGYSKPI